MPRKKSPKAPADYLRPPWSPAEDAELGTAPDAVIAARLGRSRGSVAGRRHYLGIASPSKRGRPPGITSPWHPSLRGPRRNGFASLTAE